MVTLINSFKVHGSGEDFERVFKESTELMCRQPGFIHFRLVHSLRRPDVYVNIAQWEDAASHMRVVQSEEFQTHIRDLAAVAEASPDLYLTVFEGDPVQA
ncbi:MAG: long-chain acyl-CoA synthetase [Actinomycetota bacterium]|jgi:heme-degrading monooxygenase HmoA|nr:long-chain acyl-CoA synthetase [Actinomycetota bacterium]